MKRRFLSLAMALMVLLSLMPGAAIAANEDGEQSANATAQTLYAYWLGDLPGGGSRGELLEGNSEGTWIGDWGGNWGVLFYTDEAGTVSVPDTAAITFVPDSGTAADAVKVTYNNDDSGSWNVAYNGLGSGVLQVTVNGVVYEREVLSRLPNYGFSRETTITTATYLPDDSTFTYDETNDTFYYVVDADMGITIIGVSGAGSLNWSINSTGTLVTFTVPAGVDVDGEYDIQISVQNTYTNETWTWYSGIHLAGTGRRVVAQSDYRDYGVFYENEDDTYDVSTSLTPGSETGRVFYIRDNGVVTLAQNYSVSSSDPSVVTVEKLGTAANTGNTIYNIIAHNFGTANVVLTFDGGEVLTYPVHVVLPNRGFSTAVTLKEDTYIADREFYYTDTSRTFYYVINRDDLTVSDVTLEGNLANGLGYAISDDGRVVTFTVQNGVTADLDGDIFITMEYQGGGTNRSGWSFDVLNASPVMVYRHVNGSRDDLTEDLQSVPQSSVDLSSGTSHWVVFCLRENGSVTPLQNITSVVSSDPNVAAVSYLGQTDLGSSAYRIGSENLGNATITVTYDGGKTLTMPVSVVLPVRGFSTADTLTEATYISDWEFHYTENSRTFYYVVNNTYQTVSGVTIEGDLANILSYTVSTDKKVVTFTVAGGVTEDLRGNIFFALTDNGGTGNWGYSFNVLNGSPRMVYRWANGSWYDLWENLNSSTRSNVTLSPTYTHWVVFCLSSGGAVTALQNITDVVTSDPSVVAVSYMGQTDLGNPAYEIWGIGFGDATITVTYDGGKTLTMPVSVVLPDCGWSSAPTMTQQSFVVQEFTYTAAAPTLYYVANDCTLTSVQLASNCSQYADCFDIQLGTNSSGSYAAITVKSGAALPGDRWIAFEVEGTWNDGGNLSTESDICFINGDAPKLGTPSELKWNVEYSWDGTNKYTRMGSVGFKRAASDQARYEIEYYRVGESVPVAEGNWGWGSTNTAEYFDITNFIYDDLPSGEYYFRIRARGDGYNYQSGDWVTSGTWTYTAPQAQLAAPTGLSWDDTGDDIVMNWDAVAGAQYYEVMVYYAQTKDGEKESWGSSWDIISTDSWLWNDMIAQCGKGWYFFRVRAIPADITQARNSEWSAYSTGYWLGDVTASVNRALGNIDVSSSTVADVQQAVSNIETLDEALAADTDNSGTVAAIAQMEEKLKLSTTVDTTTAPTGFNAADVKVTGAALNIDTDKTSGTTATLEIKAVDSNNAPPALIETQYKNSIQFTMDIPEAKDTDASTPGLQLAVPVKITLPIPGNINPAFLAVLHCKEDANGNKTWEELSWPHVYQDENGKWFATFVVDSMSPFALVERQSTATVEDGKIMLDAYLPTTGGDVKFLCAVYSAEGQMLELVTLQAHASEPVAIEVSEISDGMYLKLLSVNVGGGWLPIDKEQKVPVTLQVG